jgi:hypothetical protein
MREAREKVNSNNVFLNNSVDPSYEQLIDLSKLKKSNGFNPTQICDLIMPSALYKLKTTIISS